MPLTSAIRIGPQQDPTGAKICYPVNTARSLGGTGQDQFTDPQIVLFDGRGSEQIPSSQPRAHAMTAHAKLQALPLRQDRLKQGPKVFGRDILYTFTRALRPSPHREQVSTGPHSPGRLRRAATVDQAPKLSTVISQAVNAYDIFLRESRHGRGVSRGSAAS